MDVKSRRAAKAVSGGAKWSVWRKVVGGDGDMELGDGPAVTATAGGNG